MTSVVIGQYNYFGFGVTIYSIIFFHFLFSQGSEIDTVVYVVGSPIYQTCQHVYTAVTRGVRQVIVINNPRNLEAAVKMKPFARKTKLQQFLRSDLEKPVSDEADGDLEEDVVFPSTVTGTSECLASNDDDDVFCSRNLDLDHPPLGFQTASQFLASSASGGDSLSSGQGLDRADSSCNAEDSEIWENVFKEDDDEEILAWALEVEPDVQTVPSDAQLLPRAECPLDSNPHDSVFDNTCGAGDFHISRNNLKTKQEKRDVAECLASETSDAVGEGVSDHGFVSSGDFTAERNSLRVKSERPDCLVDDSSDQFFGSLHDLTRSAAISSFPLIDQGLQWTNIASVTKGNSPKTCSTIPSECSTFPTPPQTPTSRKRSSSSSTTRLSNSAPRKSLPQRSTPFRKSGGTPAKGRRRSFTAKYDTHCIVCRGPIFAGLHQITHLESGLAKSWVHQECTLSK